MSEEKNDVEIESTKLFKNPLEKICELSTYNGYKTFYLEPGDGYSIGSLFAFPKDISIEDAEEKSFREMIVRQNISATVYFKKKEQVLGTLPQFQNLIDDVKDTQSPAFMPILPAEYETGKDFQNLSPEIFDGQECKYEKIHKQIANAFDMVRLQISRLTKKDVPEKWFLYGRDTTSKGLFRLWSLCPEKTSAICCNSSIDSIVLPIMNHKNESLNYPDGFGDYKDITGIDGDSQEILAQYRDTDVLYISNTYDIEKQKHEEQVKARLKKLKFPHINIERYDGTKVVDFSYFYQFRSEIYKETLIGRILKKIGRKREEPRMLSAGANMDCGLQSNTKPGQLTDAEKEVYMANLSKTSQTPSSGIAKARLAEAISSGKILGG